MVPEQTLTVWSFSSFLALFFYPIHYIGFVHLQDLSYSASADPAIIHFYCELSGFFRVLVPLRFYGVVDAALLTFTALTSRCIITCFDLVLRFPTFRAFFPCLFCYLFHISYSITKSLFWTLPLLCNSIEKCCVNFQSKCRCCICFGNSFQHTAPHFFPPALYIFGMIMVN